MGWIGCVRCEKFQCNFVTRTIALVRPVLHRVSWGNQTVSNAPKWYETHQNYQNVSFGSNGVDRVRSLRKIPMQLRDTDFCTSSKRFAPSFVRLPNCKKCTQMVWNAPKHEFRVQRMHPNTRKHNKTWVWGPMGSIGCVRCEKFRRDFILLRDW